MTARVEVPLARQATRITTFVAEVGDMPLEVPRIVVWAPRSSDPPDRAMATLSAVARAMNGRRVPLVLVAFDPAVHPRTNAKQIQALLEAGERSIGLVIVLDRLTGAALRFATPHGDLVPAFDHYAEEADARFVPTRATAGNVEIESLTPFVEIPTVVVTGTGCCGDLSEETAALIGYIAGRLALGAPELRR